MASIDNLNFGVILDDKAFIDAINNDIGKAKELNDTLSKALTNKLPAGSTGLRIFNTHLSRSNNLMRTLGQLTGVAFSVVGIRRFLSTLIDVTGQFEVQKMALRNMLQDIDAADKIFQDLYNFSSESTYRFSELAKYAKQLAAFNIDKNNLLETTKMLGDVASGVGVSMDRLILAYGHVKSSGFLRGIQLRSFSQNGVPILEELSKMFTEIEGKAVSLGDVFDKMMKREIGFDMVEEAFRRMTSEGGKFYQMQEVLAKTLSGQINILKGKWENLMYAIGQSQEGVLKGVVSTLTNIVSNTENFGRALNEAIAILGAYRVAMLVSIAATEGLAVAINTSLIGRAFKGILSFVARNPFALLAAGITLAVIEITKAKNALSDTEKITKALNDETQKYYSSLATEQRELEVLVGRLKTATEGTEEYRLAKAALEKRFDPYIQQLRNEGVAVSDLTALYSGLVEKIRDAQREKFLERAQSAIVEAYGTARDNIESSTQFLISDISRALGRQLSGVEEGSIRHYIVSGEKNSTFASLSDVLNAPRTRKVGGSISTGPELTVQEKTFAERLLELMNRETEAADTYASAMRDASLRFGQARQEILGGGETAESVIKIQSVIDGIKKIDAELATLRNKAKSSGGITETEQKRIEALTEDREEQAKLYKSIMGADYNKSVKTAQTEQNKAVKDRISSLKAEISILEKYRDAREKLEPFFGEQTDLQLSKLFGARDYSSLDSELQGLIASLRALGDEGAQAADQIESRLGVDALGLLLTQQKNLKKYEDTLADWMGKDFSASGTGVEYKAARIAAKYNEDLFKTQKKFNDAVREATEAHKGDAVAIAAEVEKLKALRDEEMRYLSVKKDEDITALANEAYKQATGDLDLTNWADKTIGELNAIKEALDNLELPSWVHSAFKYNPEGFEKFVKAFKELAGNDSSKADDEEGKKKLENFRKYAQLASSLAGSLKELGEAIGSPELAGMGEMLGFITETASSVFERLSKGDVPGAIIAAATAALSHIVSSLAEAARTAAQIRATAEEIRKTGLSNMLSEGIDSVFGSNEMAKVNNAISAIDKVRKHQAALGNVPSVSYKKGFWDYVTFGLAHHTSSLSELASELGADLYDAYGNLNANTLQAILDTYKGIGQAEKEWITQAINDSNAYTEAMKQLEGVVSSVFGQIASSSADAIVEQWKERGDAALDYADILDDVATRYAKMMIESAILDKVLTPEKASAIVDMFARGDAEGAMERIADDMQAVRDMEPVWGQILQALDPYFNRTSGSGTDPLKDGINKELVEGNSSLIASYMNAMRADLSVLRQLQTAGWADVRLVRETMPTLADHVARIEANTYDNAVAAQGILSKLSSIITPSTNGGSAVRTTK